MPTRGKSTLRLTRPSEVRLLMETHGFFPRRALGQNFLVDGNILDILVEAAGIAPGDRILEIGPGLGVVTEALLARGAVVVAVEKDHHLFAMLRERLADHEQLELVEGDALELSTTLVKDRSLRGMVSNLPYNPGTRILVDLICADPAPQFMVITVQLEVAERLVAAPGGKSFGILGLWAQLHYASELLKVVSPRCFHPQPAVKSAIVRLRRRLTPLLSADQFPFFYDLTRYVFQHRRKQLASILGKAPEPYRVPLETGRGMLRDLGVSETARPEEVPMESWILLAPAIRAIS